MDYLIFSSHKTGTQTLVSTLKLNGFESAHCHVIPKNGRPNELGFRKGRFIEYLDSYRQTNGNKLKIITVFRAPIERHVSSFFQWHGSKPLRNKDVDRKSETIIFQFGLEELQRKLISELSDQSLVGYRESLHVISDEIGIPLNRMNLSKESDHFVHESEYLKLHIFHFDTLFSDLRHKLELLLGCKIQLKSNNQSEKKWYSEIYNDFKSTLRLPNDVISDVYSSKKDIVEMLFDKNYSSILRDAIRKHGN